MIVLGVFAIAFVLTFLCVLYYKYGFYNHSYKISENLNMGNGSENLNMGNGVELTHLLKSLPQADQVSGRTNHTYYVLEENKQGAFRELGVEMKDGHRTLKVKGVDQRVTHREESWSFFKEGEHHQIFIVSPQTMKQISTLQLSSAEAPQLLELQRTDSNNSVKKLMQRAF